MSFDPTLFKNASYKFSGATKTIGFSKTSSIYSNTPSNEKFVTVNHRGYLFTKQAGEYTLSSLAVDGVTLLWLGPTALSSFNRENANLIQVFNQKPVFHTATFMQNQYVPIRIIYAHGGRPGHLKFEIKAPDGSIIVGDNKADDSSYLVQYSCDLTSAPRFP